MKKTQNILKHIKSSLLITCLLSSFNAYCADNNLFYQSVNSEIKGLMREYKGVKPLQAELFDSNDNSIKSFIEGTSNSKADHALAVQYFPKLAINGTDTSFCFIFFDSKKDIFSQYKSTSNMSDSEILNYLTWHEMGHCFAKHENFSVNPKINEFIADAFAISVSINRDKNYLSTKIIKNIAKLDLKDIHANKPELEQFLLTTLNANFFIKKRTVNEIVEMIKIYYEESNLKDTKKN